VLSVYCAADLNVEQGWQCTCNITLRARSRIVISPWLS